MDKLRAMQVFREVVKCGSFSAAGESLNLVNSAVSRQVSELERLLETKLLYRTTRALSLTHDGRVYLEKIDEILEGVSELEQLAEDSHQTVRGSLKITAPTFLGRHVLEPLLLGFLISYPQVKVSLLLVDRFINLVEEGFDLAIRVGELPDSSLFARKMGDTRLKCVASPEYIKKSGIPKTPNELRGHNCLFDSIMSHKKWAFKDGHNEYNIEISGNMAVNNGEMVCQMAINSVGIAYLPDFFVNQALDEGKVVELLSEYSIEPYPISMLYPQNRHKSLALNTLMDYISSNCR